MVKTGFLETIFRKEDKTAQQTIPYKEMFPNGICALENNVWNKTIEFDDISYQLADQEAKLGMFHAYCSFINFFHEDISVQFTFLNQKVNQDIIDRQITLPSRDDQYAGMCDEFQAFLKKQNMKGNNGLIKRKFITFGTHTQDYNEAKNRLERIETSVQDNFKRLGCKTQTLSGKSRLNLLFRCMNRNKKFIFSWEKLKASGKTTKDIIAPAGFDFTIMNSFKMGLQVASSAYVDLITEELDDNFLSELLELNQGMMVSIHVRAFNQKQAQKAVRQKLSSLRAQANEIQKSARDRGYGNVPLPPELQKSIDHLEELYSKITDQNQRLFNVVMVITNIADNLEELLLETKATDDVVQTANCQLQRLSWQQENGLIASLPLGVQPLKKERTLSTYSLAILMPFITKNLFQINKGALYYGINPLNNNMIMASRKLLRTPNGLILGTPGSGKSFASKQEKVNILLATDYDIITLDPEGEYLDFTKHVGGTIINISPVSTEFINPLDITVGFDDEDDVDPIIMKTDFILSFFELLMDRALTAGEKSILSRCVQIIYTTYLKTPLPEKMPVLEDLYKELKLIDDEGDEGRSREIAAELSLGLELYVYGQMKVFNNRTNVNINNRVINFNLKELGETLWPLGMLIVQEYIWQRVRKNREAGITTCYDCDECHLLLRKEQTARYSVDIYKRFRKWDAIVTFITQNVKDFLRSQEIETIFGNSDFVILLNQNADDLRILSKELTISPELAEKAKNVDKGQGIIIYDDIQLPFVNKFPKNTQLYRVMTTDPDEIKKFKEQDALMTPDEVHDLYDEDDTEAI